MYYHTGSYYVFISDLQGLNILNKFDASHLGIETLGVMCPPLTSSHLPRCQSISLLFVTFSVHGY